MQISISKQYKIIGSVSESHGECKGSVITCVGFDEDGDVMFDGLVWNNGQKGTYLLVPDTLMCCSSEQYNHWLSTVLEEI